MKLDKVKVIIEKLPITMLMVCYLGYLVYDYYLFENDNSSPKVVKKKDVNTIKAGNVKLTAKLKEMNEFAKTLETKKAEIRNLAQTLQNLKGTLSDVMDDASFIKIMYTEAKKLGIDVINLRPKEIISKEYYSEKTFNFRIKAAFVQVYSLLERLSNINQIVRIENFSLKPIAMNSGKITLLDGELELKIFKYLGTKADNIGKAESSDEKQKSANSSSHGPVDNEPKLAAGASHK